jgi:3'-phosphoadenosine 5'-phosphosulfate sulfotransferase (PAPS reductase)/FAD synthetase
MAKTVTAANREWKAAGNTGTYRVLECVGMRAQESSGRAKMEPVSHNKRFSCATREVTTWLPIHDWKVEKVWATIKASGVPHHRAYDLGMPRLSCAFCIFSPKSALLLAAMHNPELLEEYVAVEKEIDHTFQQRQSLADIQVEARAMAAEGREVGPINDWTM